MGMDVDVVVVGAGVIGLAVARALALAGREVLVLEAESAVGTGTSSRNSEVIHAGLYYPAGSLKARFCVAGRRALYAYAETRGVTVRRLGKILVAAEEAQLAAMAAIEAAARVNGVDDLVRLDAAGARDLEPQVACVAALHSPSTGIVDSHGLMQALEGDIAAAGGSVVLRAPVLAGRAIEGGVEIEIGGAEPTRLTAGVLVNAAGLGAHRLAAAIAGIDPTSVPRLRLARGAYFSLTGVKPPFRRLVYPVPEPGGLGIHATLDLGGQVRFGPDVEWIEAIDYTVDPRRAARFRAAIRTYWPDLPENALAPAYCGIRPKLSGPGEPAADFLIQDPEANGVEGLWNLYGIESPGLTSCLAIADHVRDRIAAEPDTARAAAAPPAHDA